METLDLFKGRRNYEVILQVKGNKKLKCKIPCELTVEETERLMEQEVILSQRFKAEVSEEKTEQDQKLQEYFETVFEIISIMFSRYQPEMTPEKMKSLLTEKEAVKVLQFFKEKRFLQLLGLAEEEKEAKKKLKAQ